MGLFSSKKIDTKLFQNPANAPALNLLGVGDFTFNPKRGLGLREGALDRGLAGGSLSTANAFGPEQLAQIANFIGGGGRNEQLDIDAERLALGIAPAIEESNEFFTNELDPALRELVSTGFRSDTDAIREGALHGFSEETLPEAFERLSNFGVGLGSSAAQETVGSLAADLEAELAGFEFAADEAASGRRVEGLGLSQNLFDANILRQSLGSQAVLGANDALEAADPGSQLLQALLALTGGVSAPQPFAQGFAPSKGEQIFAAVNQAFGFGGSGLGGGVAGGG